MNIVEAILGKLLELIFKTVWGKITFAVVGLLFFLFWMLTVRARKRIQSRFAELERQWPEFSWRALECRARTVAELYVHGWNGKNLTALESHFTPDGFLRLNDHLRDTLAERKYKRLELCGFEDPRPVQITTPNDDRPATVLVQITIPLTSWMGSWEASFQLEMIYADDGRWLVNQLTREDSFFLLLETENDFETAWLEQNSLPRAHEETASPLRPMPPIPTPVAGQKKALNRHRWRAIAGAVTAILAFLISVLLLMNQVQALNLIENGERIETQVLEVKPSEEGRYKVRFYLRLPDDETAYPSLQFLRFRGPAEVTADAGKLAMETRRITVLYLPENPAINQPEGATIARFWWPLIVAFGSSLALFVVAVRHIRAFKRMSQPDYSFFWDAWEGRDKRESTLV